MPKLEKELLTRRLFLMKTISGSQAYQKHYYQTKIGKLTKIWSGS